jgi:hypothetical protein
MGKILLGIASSPTGPRQVYSLPGHVRIGLQITGREFVILAEGSNDGEHEANSPVRDDLHSCRRRSRQHLCGKMFEELQASAVYGPTARELISAVIEETARRL